MTVASPRIFIVDFDLIGYTGHFFNQVFGFREAARERGLESRIYIPRSADPRVISDLDARTLLPFISRSDGSMSRHIEGFADAQRALTPLFNDLEAAIISDRDILVVTSSRPQAIFAVAQWMRSRSASPAVFFRFFGPEFLDFATGAFWEDAWAYQFASRLLFAVEGEERIFFTLNNRSALGRLEQLSQRRAFYLPVPKYYGSLIVNPGGRPVQALTIYVHTNVRSGQLLNQISQLAREIRQKHGDVNFLLRLLDNQNSFSADLTGNGLELIPADQNQLEYLTTIDRADMILLPYDPVQYRGIVSGIFCEAVAMGKVAIIPAGTWMADHVSDELAAGVLFEKNSVDGMFAAVEQAIQDRQRLQSMAHRCAGAFRQDNSCASNLDGMIELASQTHDMRLSGTTLIDVTQTMISKHYLGEGWSLIEEGFGVWSDGDRAEIKFSIRPDARPLFFSAQVRPFLTAGHARLEVSVRANNVPVADWSFDAARHDHRDWSWHHVLISDEIVASGEIQIELRFRSPASPKDFGLSIDSRKLGIALRRFSLQPELPDMSLVEAKPQKWPRVRRWLRRWK